MRNLEICEVNLKKIKLDSGEGLAVCIGLNEESASSELYICTHNLLVKAFSDSCKVKWEINILDAASPKNIPINITFLSISSSVCLGLGNGELFNINEDKYDLVGVCDNGILAMDWSPDQELLVVVTRKFKTILMSCTFDIINELNLLNEEFGDKQFVTVGWGKKETQFHGSEGKNAAKVQVEVVAEPQVEHDNTVKITWRGDGHLYAIGFTLDGIKRFKVFDREGNLQYTSEKQQGLQSNLSWRPSGNVIATTQKLPDKYIITFFEKNGLKHKEFTIDINLNTHVQELIWSSDSEILTVQCIDTDTNSQKLLLYTTNNYHWYLKQKIEYSAEQKVSKIMWDNDFDVANNKKLHVILCSGHYYHYITYNWIWNINHSRGVDHDDDAVITVIDSNKLLITGFRQTVVPPPMASLEIQVDACVLFVNFAPQKTSVHSKDLDTNTFFIYTADHQLIFFEQTNKCPLNYKIILRVQLEKPDFPFQYYNWYWVDSKIIVNVSVSNDGTYSLNEFILDGNKFKKENMTELPASVIRIQSHPADLSVLFLQLNNGDLVKYKIGGEIEPLEMSFNTACLKFNVLLTNDQLNYIGLTHKGNLIFGDKVVMNNVSSYFIHTNFLLLTTFQHILLCTELTLTGLKAISETQKNESEHIYKRKIERGAKLVIAVPCETRTIFQMPRGNLEAIQPRPLSLRIIGEYLDNFKYHEAFNLMRKQRINLNLIYDHDPEKFINNIDKFLESVDNNSWLNLFLSDLESSDVTRTMYSSSYAARSHSFIVIETKVQKICDIIREQLSKRSDSENKILPILTSYVRKKSTNDIEKALYVIKDLKIRESGGSRLPVGSDEALKYLLYMVDVNQLFDVALGMYDFDLVLLIANKSHKDPKEYVPMLNELNEMDENYKKFTINKHLKRFDKAVQCLVKCGPKRHNELKTFVKYHSLYREALDLLSQGDDIYKQISDDFGLNLKLKKQFLEAGIVYERAFSIDKAIECYKDALEWDLAINVAQSWPDEKFTELCWDLVHKLKDEKRSKEGLLILEKFIKNDEKIIMYAIESGQYKSALRLCDQYKKQNLKDCLIQALCDDYKNIMGLIEANWINFIKHRERLYVVRENKKNNPVEEYESLTTKDSDLYSDAGSTIASSSRGSSRSFRSSKNRRKHERKVASLKEGSQYEDVALVLALHSLVTSSFELRLEVKEIVIVLSCCNKDKEALKLQISFEKLLKEMKDSFKLIWTNELIMESTNARIAAQNVPEGCSVIPQGIASLEPHIVIAPVISDLNWKLNGLN